MKIAVLTRRYGYNYGSSLQACAIRIVLESLNHEVEILNYDEFSQHPLWYIKPFLSSVKDHLVCFFNKTDSHINLKRKQIEAFSSFDKNIIKPTKKKLRFSFQLRKAVIDKDCVICGSDQIWSPILFDKHFFLDFIKSTKIRKIAFAPSFGVSQITKHRTEIKEYLSDFSRLSVRERQGKELLEDLLGKGEYPILLDPTMLVPIGIWDNLLSGVSVPKKYIACYFLGENIPFDYIYQLATQKRCKILNITTFRTLNTIKGEQAASLSPLEFLYVIKNADCVITDSFHASVFSIMYHKYFYVFNRFKDLDLGNQNSRIYNLLSNLELSQCHITNMKSVGLEYPKINYNKVDCLLDKMRVSSFKFLEDALSS